MANELYIYTTPAEAAVSLVLDTGQALAGVRVTANGRDDAHLIQLPPNTAGQGGTLYVECEGYVTRQDRGLVIPSSSSPALFMLDDVHLTPATATPTPEPPPVPMPDDPEGIIRTVYETGDFDLATKEGCGQFTEACCTSLHDHNSTMWGHIKKSGGQNQFNGHAVDAVQLLAGTDCGIYDIIHDSESSNASPAFNYKGAPDAELWYYPA